TRGRIGVEIYPNPITEEYARELNLPRAGGAEVARVLPGGPSEAAGLQAGDVIVEYNGQPVVDDSDLVSRVLATRPGTTVPVKVVRTREVVTLNATVEELDLSTEVASAEGGPSGRGGRAQETNLGMSVAPLTPQAREQFGVPADRNGVVVVSTTPFGPADQATLQQGDVILSVQGTAVSTPDELQAAAANVSPGGIVRLIIWRASSDGEGAEILIRLRKP